MDDCNIINDLLLDYINRNLSKEDNSMVIMHLSRCKDCLNELAQIIALRDMLNFQLEEIPEAVKAAAYDKVRVTDSHVIEIISKKSPFMAFELINYLLEPVNETLSLVAHVI